MRQPGAVMAEVLKVKSHKLDRLYCGVEGDFLHPYWPMAYNSLNNEALRDVRCQEWVDDVLTEWKHPLDELRMNAHFTLHHLERALRMEIESQDDYTEACLRMRDSLLASGHLKLLDPSEVYLITGKGVINNYAITPIAVGTWTVSPKEVDEYLESPEVKEMLESTPPSPNG